MNFTGLLEQVKEDPALELKEIYHEIKLKLSETEDEKKGIFVAENSIDRSLKVQEWDTSQKDNYMKILVDLYSDLIGDMYRKIDTIIGGIESENERKLYELFIDISNDLYICRYKT